MTDGTSTTEIVWNDSHQSSPNNGKKPLKLQLPSPFIPQNMNSKRLSIASVHEPTLPIGLPRVISQHSDHNSSNFHTPEMSQNLLIDDSDMPILPPLQNTYVSESTTTTFITTSTRTLHCDSNEQPENDTYIYTGYAENQSHSQPKINQQQNNSKNNESNNNNNNNNNQTNNNGFNRNNKDNKDDEKKQNNNNYITETQQKHQNQSIAFVKYTPNKIYKIKISKDLTTKIIPNNVKEIYIRNVYDYLYKSLAICLIDGIYCECNYFKIFNCGFHNKKGQTLYFIADNTNQKGYQYVMRDILYTSSQILKQFGMYRLPQTAFTKISMDDDETKEIDEIFNNNDLCQNVISKTKWHKLYVFNTMSNKQRLTFSITKNEFVFLVKQFLCNGNNKALLPIVMFTNHDYRIEYIQIIPLRKNIFIGVSFINTEYGIKVTGIHLNKNSILQQHLLAFPHDCHCLDSFVSDIDCLHIGNPDDDKNRHNDIKNKHNILKNKHQQLQSNFSKMQDDNVTLRNKIAQLENDKQLLTNVTGSLIHIQQPMQQLPSINTGLTPISQDTTLSTISTNTPSHSGNTPTLRFSAITTNTPITPNIRLTPVTPNISINTHVVNNNRMSSSFPYNPRPHPMIYSNSLSSQSSANANATAQYQHQSQGTMNNLWHSQPNSSRNNNYNMSNNQFATNVQSQHYGNNSQQSGNLNNNRKFGQGN